MSENTMLYVEANTQLSNQLMRAGNLAGAVQTLAEATRALSLLIGRRDSRA